MGSAHSPESCKLFSDRSCMRYTFSLCFFAKINNRIRNCMSLPKNVAVLFLELIGDATIVGLKI